MKAAVVVLALIVAGVADAGISTVIDIDADSNAVARLGDAINAANRGDAVLVRIDGQIEIAGDSLPPITGGSLTIGPKNLSAGDSSGIHAIGPGRLLEVRGGSVDILGLTISGFSRSDRGGALLITGGDLSLNNCYLNNNSAGTTGGAISTTGSGSLVVGGCVFEQNSAGVFGCDIDVQSSRLTSLFYNFFDGGNCENVVIENPRGDMRLLNNTLRCGADCVDSTALVQVLGNTFESNVDNKVAGHKAACNDFGSNAFESLGFNLDTDGSCALDQPTDLPNTDPELEAPDESGIVRPKPSSPLVDGALDGLTSLFGAPQLPCGYKDASGLGRPQDGDGDGTFECDIGSVELQGGADIGPAQSGAFFDTGRSGEGVFVELIGNGQAFVAMFTYAPDGSTLAWFVGVGQVVGNSVVVDEVLITDGGAFGDGFDAGNISKTRVGGMSLVFPSCESVNQPGRISFQAQSDSAFSDLQVDATRLTSILNCSGAPPARSGRSGSFFDPARDGEGIFVQWLPDGRVLVIWYTYDPTGNQFWIISDQVTVDGDTLTATMLYPAQRTGFGDNFDSDDIVLQDWGTVTLDYDGCNQLVFSYDSSVAGFGSGSFDYVRLTALEGTSCDL